jgi:hypothetical protein
LANAVRPSDVLSYNWSIASSKLSSTTPTLHLIPPGFGLRTWFLKMPNTPCAKTAQRFTKTRRPRVARWAPKILVILYGSFCLVSHPKPSHVVFAEAVRVPGVRGDHCRGVTGRLRARMAPCRLSRRRWKRERRLVRATYWSHGYGGRRGMSQASTIH